MINKTTTGYHCLPRRDKVSARVWSSCSSQHSHLENYCVFTSNAQHTCSSNSTARCTSNREAYICEPEDALDDSVQYKVQQPKTSVCCDKTVVTPGSVWGLHTWGLLECQGAPFLELGAHFTGVSTWWNSQNSLRIDGCSFFGRIGYFSGKSFLKKKNK